MFYKQASQCFSLVMWDLCNSFKYIKFPTHTWLDSRIRKCVIFLIQCLLLLIIFSQPLNQRENMFKCAQTHFFLFAAMTTIPTELRLIRRNLKLIWMKIDEKMIRKKERLPCAAAFMCFLIEGAVCWILKF